MKVVLLQDVARIGRRHDIKDVPDGLAHNLLIPRKQALPATPDNIAKAKQITSRRIARKEEAHEVFRKTAAALDGAHLTLRAPANQTGSLFKGIHAEDIAKLVSKEVGQLDAAYVALPAPIRQAGEYTIPLEANGYSGSVTITIAPA
ncbi:50S ribosomal protein L9 [Candidatus Kaiserbacteria bacterium RIFCSPHIGHO2_02_FULL_50_50]|uniref:Large ribosomal subunit protein bL9 n=1 Tax=Candidatus Kaiserbacteria bacterium RIFCSPHIGHO2_02_FULL_50_50 TaxID=1798492 RepID=A0A1F6DGY1_9BACT|nr:MAG: 50S ribosomal protein L9 [Candidatus Kaiserbacteria bacterium RIFCSPHIGHO2_02_FULL_50_50]OGG88915.1 MAG: 50S ribosomal protein L9 [Candidatus Kaiserbacteria bacterium RIFCSPLOWO2_12_FULL_50_10]